MASNKPSPSHSSEPLNDMAPKESSKRDIVAVQPMGFSIVIVETLITVTVLVAAFEYDRIRSRQGNFTVFERFGVYLVFSILITVILYALFHKRLHLFGHTFLSPIETAPLEEAGLEDVVE